MKKIELLHFTVAKNMSVNCSTLSSSCHFFCHYDKICVEQLFSCKKCRAIACRAIAIRAVHPHSFFHQWYLSFLLKTFHLIIQKILGWKVWNRNSTCFCDHCSQSDWSVWGLAGLAVPTSKFLLHLSGQENQWRLQKWRRKISQQLQE